MATRRSQQDIPDAMPGREYQGSGVMNKHGRFGSTERPASMAGDASGGRGMKVLSPTVHAVLDYALAALFLILPGALGFSDTAASLSYIIGVAYILVSLLTKYPLGAIKMIPFPVHGVIESIMAAAWIVMPWLFGFAGDTAARNFFVIAGIGLLAVAAVTNYRATGPRSAYSGEERRHHMIDRRQRALRIENDRRTGMADRRGSAYAGA